MNHDAYFQYSSFKQSVVAVTAGAAWQLAVAANPMRVSLIITDFLAGGISAFSLNANDFPIGEGIAAGGPNFGLELEFPIHGPLTCQDWYVSSAAGAGNVYILEQIIDTAPPCQPFSTDPYPKPPLPPTPFPNTYQVDDGA